MSKTCDAPSPGGGLQCVLPPHATGGHLWHHSTAGGEPKEAVLEQWWRRQGSHTISADNPATNKAFDRRSL